MSRVKGCVRPRFVRGETVGFDGVIRVIKQVKLSLFVSPRYGLGAGEWIYEFELTKLKNEITWEMCEWKPEGLKE